VIFVVLTTQAVQCAGEEYIFRGVLFRAIGSFFSTEITSVIIGGVISSVLFMAGHLSVNPWENLSYLVFGMSMAVVTWRTGGLESAVAMHSINNTFILLVGAFQPEDTTSKNGIAAILIEVVIVITVTLVFSWVASRENIIRSAQPVQSPFQPNQYRPGQMPFQPGYVPQSPRVYPGQYGPQYVPQPPRVYPGQYAPQYLQPPRSAQPQNNSVPGQYGSSWQLPPQFPWQRPPNQPN
ncbi:MAG: hypothetical protein CR979_03575, partial [Propionibacterium sp.]